MTKTMTLDEWPNKGPEVVRVAIVMAVLSALSTIWRLVLRFRVSAYMGSSDWLMLFGTVRCEVHFHSKEPLELIFSRP